MHFFLFFLAPIFSAVQAGVSKKQNWTQIISIIASVVTFFGFGSLAVQSFFTLQDLGKYGSIDRFGSLMVLLIVFVYLSATLVGLRYFKKEKEENAISERKFKLYYTLFPLFIVTMLVAVISNHMGILWIALESTTLTTVLLVALYKKDGSIEAAWKYLLLCSIGISLGLFGVFLFVYALFHAGIPLEEALFLDTLVTHAKELNPQIIKWAFVFLFVGIGTKVGFVPLHTWLPDAHSRTPSPLSAVLSGVLLNVALFAILRFKNPVDMAIGNSEWTNNFFWIFGLISVVFAAFVLLHQKNYKRMLAYHSVEHMGLIAFAIGMGPLGAVGAVMHMIGHTLAKSALFFSAGEILLQTHTTKINFITGYWKKSPKTSLGFLLGFLCLIGAPTSMIFSSEFTFLVAATQKHIFSAVVIIIALTIVCVGVLHHILVMLFSHEKDEKEEITIVEPLNITHVVVLVEIILLFAGGIFFLTKPGFEFASSIAHSFVVNL